MKISSIGSINTLNNKNIQKTSSKNDTLNYATSNSISNNSLQEAIGRSQVSFSGSHKLTGAKFTYTQNNIGSTSENIVFDKATGVMEYTEKYSNGALKKIIRLNPRTQEELVQEFEKDGFVKTTRNTPEQSRYNETDAQGRLLYEETEKGDEKLCSEYDYDNRRIIHTFYESGSENPVVSVWDITTKKELPPTDTRLLDHQKVRTKQGYFDYQTYDLTTGDIYKSEIKDGSTLIEGFERSFETGETIWTAKRVNNKLHQSRFDEKDGKIKEKTVYDYSDNTELVQTYNKAGELTSKEKKKYSWNGALLSVTEFNPQTNKVQFHTIHGKNSYRVDEYSEDGTSRVSSREFDLNDYLFKKTFYQEDGVTPKQIIEHSETGFEEAKYARKIVTNCDRKGKVAKTSYYDKDDNLYQVSMYEKGSKYPVRIRTFNYENGSFIDEGFNPKGQKITKNVYNKNGRILSFTEYHPGTNNRAYFEKYNRDGSTYATTYTQTGLPEKLTIYDEKGDILEENIYYADGKSVESRTCFNKDGSYVSIHYDPDGRILDSFEAYADGTPKPARETRSKSNNSKTTEYTIEEVVQNIHDISGSQNKSINDVDMKQWMQFAKYLGLDDVSKLFEMDKDTYRQLAKKYHPDKNAYMGNEIMQIINSLYEKQ